MSEVKEPVKARMSLCELEARIADAKKLLGELNKEREDKLRKQLVLCLNCGNKTRISSLVFLKKIFYIEPHGCTGGDYWAEDEPQHTFECPHCHDKWHNRMCMREKLKGANSSGFLLAHRHLFKETKEVE